MQKPSWVNKIVLTAKTLLLGEGAIADAHKISNNLKDYFLAYKGPGYEVAGFCWWQGHHYNGNA